MSDLDNHVSQTNDVASHESGNMSDKRYQAAIADVVEWLGRGGASTMPHMVIAGEIARRFGKDA